LQKATQISHFPVVAIGGINQHNLNDVVYTGVDGIALVSAICHAKDPKTATFALRKQIEQAATRNLN
jgi:thiamine-phosphate pyrophosphorylase